MAQEMSFLDSLGAAGLAWSSDGKQIWRESDAAKESLFTQARSVLVSSGLNSGLVTCDL